MGRRPGGPENKMEATAMNDISKNIRYVGVNDHAVDLFEGQYKVPGGMSYNSYVILDEKTAVLDTVDAHFTDEWLRNVAAALDGRQPDYLIVHHMEPDHSANIAEFLKVYPQATVVATAKALAMMGEFFEGLDLTGRTLAAANGGTLSLGAHELNFVFAPMVHWPEVMFSYESSEKVLFSADGFGKFGALDVEEDWVPEARRYYIGIVGKYGVQVQNVLKKAAALDIAAIAPLHGPVLRGDLGLYLEKYNAWSSYTPEEDGILSPILRCTATRRPRPSCWPRRWPKRARRSRSCCATWPAPICPRPWPTRSATASSCWQRRPTTATSSRSCGSFWTTWPSATSRSARWG